MRATFFPKLGKLTTMQVIGLTGGIGSGKSTVASIFKQAGIEVIDMDQVARRLSQPGQEAYQKIIDQFGLALLNKDKTINRKLLASVVFSNSENLDKLENILHPYIRATVTQQLANLDSKLCIVEIPLLNKRDQFNFIDIVLVVDTKPENQYKRIQNRDSLNKSQINAIMNAQLDRESRLKLADEIITNNDSIEVLEKNVAALIAKYTIKAKNT